VAAEAIVAVVAAVVVVSAAVAAPAAVAPAAVAGSTARIRLHARFGLPGIPAARRAQIR